ncbi:MAG: hypothetical protein KJO23_02700 [Bacteroidia bacterium]|nr:hypothetical protein [Bacteroidia bacterium]NNM23923.1 hypothetical protein [Flavobacteriaceae bacterium]
MKSNNRFDLQMEKGDEIKRNCDLCGTHGITHINRLDAEPNRMALIIALSLGVVLTGFVFYFGWIASITFLLPIWFYFDQQKRATDFNKIKVPRK